MDQVVYQAYVFGYCMDIDAGNRMWDGPRDLTAEIAAACALGTHDRRTDTEPRYRAAVETLVKDMALSGNMPGTTITRNGATAHIPDPR